MGLLDDLKKQADALKANEVDRTESLRSTAVAVDHSLRRSFLYLNDLGKQLNVVQMPSPFKYNLPTVGDVDGLIVKDFFCDFRVQGKLEGDHETGKLKIVTKNVGGFQVDLFNLLAHEMNEQAVEEFAKFFIGRPNKWEDLVKRSVLNNRPAAPPPRPRTEPQYVAAVAPAVEEKRSLLGSLGSLIKKKD